MKTFYASPEKSSEVELKNQQQVVSAEYLLNNTLDSIPIYVFILNKNRQIVFANSAFRENLSDADLARLLGSRPGEILNCVHSDELEGGCGTSKFCAKCGAVNAILKSQKMKSGIDECRIIQKDGNALDLLVWANQIKIKDESFTLFAVTDTSSQKRRRALERIFFHDVLNTAGSVRGFIDLLKTADPDEVEELLNLAEFSINNLIEEINSQRLLTLAESDELVLSKHKFFTSDLLDKILKGFECQEIAADKHLSVFDWSENIEIECDKLIIRRILVNLIKNALEASKEGQKIMLGCKLENEQIVFKVYNENVIPKDVQLQLFQRSFSTKGLGRGLGTYSVKLLTEKYLKGNVSFTSNNEEGTAFYIRIPVNN